MSVQNGSFKEKLAEIVSWNKSKGSINLVPKPTTYDAWERERERDASGAGICEWVGRFIRYNKQKDRQMHGGPWWCRKSHPLLSRSLARSL